MTEPEAFKISAELCEETGKMHVVSNKDISPGSVFFIEDPLAIFSLDDTDKDTVQAIQSGFEQNLYKKAKPAVTGSKDMSMAETVYKFLELSGFIMSAEAQHICDTFDPAGGDADVKKEEAETKRPPPNYNHRKNAMLNALTVRASLSCMLNRSSGMAIYKTVSHCQRSCSPNADMCFWINGAVTLIANDKIKAGESITIAINSWMCTLPHGIARIDASKSNECKCSVCKDSAKIVSEFKQPTLAETCQVKISIRRDLVAFMDFARQNQMHHGAKLAFLKHELGAAAAEHDKQLKMFAMRQRLASQCQKKNLKKRAKNKLTKTETKTEQGISIDAALATPTATSATTLLAETKSENKEEKGGVQGREPPMDHPAKKALDKATRALADMEKQTDLAHFVEAEGPDMFLSLTRVAEVLEKLHAESKESKAVVEVIDRARSWIKKTAESGGAAETIQGCIAITQSLIDLCVFTKHEAESKTAVDIAGPNKFVHKYLSEDVRKRIFLHGETLENSGAGQWKHMWAIFKLLEEVCKFHGGPKETHPSTPAEIMRTLLVETNATYYLILLCEQVLFFNVDATSGAVRIPKEVQADIYVFLDKFVMPYVPKSMEDGCKPFRTIRFPRIITITWATLFARVHKILMIKNLDVTKELALQFMAKMSRAQNFIAPTAFSTQVSQYTEQFAELNDRDKQRRRYAGTIIPQMDFAALSSFKNELTALLTLHTTMYYKQQEDVDKLQAKYIQYFNEYQAGKLLKRQAHELTMKRRAERRDLGLLKAQIARGGVPMDLASVLGQADKITEAVAKAYEETQAAKSPEPVKSMETKIEKKQNRKSKTQSCSDSKRTPHIIADKDQGTFTFEQVINIGKSDQTRSGLRAVAMDLTSDDPIMKQLAEQEALNIAGAGKAAPTATDFESTNDLVVSA